MDGLDLKSLINGSHAEKRVAQKQLYKQFYGYAMGICLRYCSNRYEATEIMNQGFMKVFTKLHKYDANCPFKPWLGRIMVNTSIDHYRSNLKAKFEDLETAEHYSCESTADGELDYKDLLNMVQKLSTAYRTVFNLFAIEGYSHEEISNMLKIDVGTSKSNLFKARRKLKEMVLSTGNGQQFNY